MPDPEGERVGHRAGAAQLGQQQRKDETPDRVIEEPRRQAVPRSRLAGSARLRALELRHAKLEDPARVFLRLVGAEEHALLAAPVEDREVRRRNQHGRRRAAPPARPGHAMDDAVDDRQHQQREREPHEHLLRDQDRVGGRDRDDGCGDERAEEDAQSRGHERRAAERRDALRETRVMENALRRRHLAVEARLQDLVLLRLGLGRLHVRLLARFRHGVADDVRDPLFGRAVRNRQLLVVADAPFVVAQYAAGMIDEAQCLFDIALSIPRLRIIFADQPAQRGPDLLIRGGLRYSQRFVQRRSHRGDGMPERAGQGVALLQESSGKSAFLGKGS